MDTALINFLVSQIMGKSLEDKLILQGREIIWLGPWLGGDPQYFELLGFTVETKVKNCHVYRFCTQFLTASLWNLCRALEITWKYLKTTMMAHLGFNRLWELSHCIVPGFLRIVFCFINDNSNKDLFSWAFLNASKFTLGMTTLIFSLISHYSSIFCLLSSAQTKKVNIFSESYFILLVYDITEMSADLSTDLKTDCYPSFYK